ncbi:MAG: DUF4330 domain-containing protein [Firmicutes bacterium]|nr:DUF4330 domain-containing protein [Bacillota bacterium]
MIDEKGRLFGKINIIDLLVILVIAAALCFAVFRYVLPDRNSGKAVQKELVLYCHDTPRFTAEQIEKGVRVWDQGYDVVLGTVKSFEITPLMETVTDASGKTHLVESDWLVSVTLVLDAEGVPDEFGIRIGGSLYASGHTMTVFAGDAKLYLKVQEIR